MSTPAFSTSQPARTRSSRLNVLHMLGGSAPTVRLILKYLDRVSWLILSVSLLGHAKLVEFLASPAPEFKELYQSKLPAAAFLAALFGPDPSAQAKQMWFQKSTAVWEGIAKFFDGSLPSYLPESGFIGGDKPGEPDFFLGAWLSRVVLVCKGDQTKKEGIQTAAKVLGKALDPKIVKYWELSVSRPAWQKVFNRDGIDGKGFKL